MPDELGDWNPALGWHERENVHYNVVREPKLHRTYAGENGSFDPKFGRRTTWLKNSTGWFRSENQVLWLSLPNPRLQITEWIDKAVFVFELSVFPKQKQTLEFVAASPDDRKIDIDLRSSVTWHDMFLDQGPVTNNNTHLLSHIAYSICDTVNLNWSNDEDTVDTIEAVNLGAKGVYSSLIGTLLIVLHTHKAELLSISGAHVRSHAYSDSRVIICRSLFQDSNSESSCPRCACPPSR